MCFLVHSRAAWRDRRLNFTSVYRRTCLSAANDQTDCRRSTGLTHRLDLYAVRA